MEIEILPFKIQRAYSKLNSPCLKSRGHHGKILDQKYAKKYCLTFLL